MKPSWWETRNMHKATRSKKITGTGGSGKIIVMGMLERGGKAKATVVQNRNRATIQDVVFDNIEANANIFTDEFAAYTGLQAVYAHQVINHAEEYVNTCVARSTRTEWRTSGACSSAV